MNNRFVFAIVVVAALVFAALYFALRGKLLTADFYECPPARTLVVCAPGTVPADAECRNVGSGKTTITPRNCG
jgi:hypothetical protein